jgi:prepilin-type processing-associated H-X9-DG protein
LKDYSSVAGSHGTMPGGADQAKARGTIYTCPSDEIFNDAPASDPWAPSSYGSNRANFIDPTPDVGADVGRPRYKVAAVDHPSASSCFMDQNAGTPGISSATTEPGLPFAQASSWNPVHNNGMNTLYVDGHVDWTLLQQLPATPADVFST